MVDHQSFSLLWWVALELVLDSKRARKSIYILTILEITEVETRFLSLEQDSMISATQCLSLLVYKFYSADVGFLKLRINYRHLHSQP